MKNLAIAAFAIGLAVAAPTLLFAQPHPDQGHPGAGGHPSPTSGHPSPMGGGAVRTHVSAPATHTNGMPHMARPSAYHHVRSHPVAYHRHVTVRHVTHTVRRVTHRIVHHVTHHVVRRTTHVVVSRGRIASLRRNIVAVHRFHAGPYRAPPGFRYRRWVFGERLPGIYFAPQFWISDFLAFGLFAPPGGYVWVRYGPDALLIDEYTGEIVQVDYGVFY